MSAIEPPPGIVAEAVVYRDLTPLLCVWAAAHTGAGE